MYLRLLALTAATGLGACGPSAGPVIPDANLADPPDAAVIDALVADAWVLIDSGPPPVIDFVYAHSATTLYSVNPETLAIEEIGPFLPLGTEMTDIALDKGGKMIGVSFGAIYDIDKTTAQTTFKSDLGDNFNALSYVTVSGIDGDDEEILVGASEFGNMYEVDPETGATMLIGDYGGRDSSGDIVHVNGFGTVATSPAVGGDNLLRLNLDDGTTEVIGNTGHHGIWGLGFWKGKIYGFTVGRKFVLIDKDTGAGTLVDEDIADWWGAGVTTEAPIIE